MMGTGFEPKGWGSECHLSHVLNFYLTAVSFYRVSHHPILTHNTVQWRSLPCLHSMSLLKDYNHAVRNTLCYQELKHEHSPRNRCALMD